MKAIKNRNIRYFLLALCLTTSLMLINKTNFLEVIKPRILFESSKKNYVCDKAGTRLTDKYKTDFEEDNIKTKELSKAQQSIIDFARDSSYSNIKPYIKRCGVFIFFLVLAIIFLILWITYCSCCACKCCLFKTSNPIQFCVCLWFIIALVCYFIVILISIIILAILNSFFSRINGVGCSFFYFIDHVRYGLTPSYIKRQNEWDGIEGLIDRLDYTRRQMIEIQRDSNEIIKDINAINTNQYDGVCKNHYDILNTNAQTINNLIRESFEEVTNSEVTENLEEVDSNFEETDNDINVNIYEAMHDHTNKWAKRICKAIFALTLIFGILGFLILTLYLILDIYFLKIIYIIIWNISMLLVFLSIIMAAVFGILGYILRDGVQVGNYILSDKNLNDSDPLIFNAGEDTYISNLINVCANGDGNFTNVIDGGSTLNEKLSDWKEHQDKFTYNRDNIKCDNELHSRDLKYYYDELLIVIKRSLNMTYTITNVSCGFAKNDKNIILNEADEGGIKGLGLSACSFLVGIFLLFSVFAGILLVHKYQYRKNLNHLNHNTKGSKMNESSTNIDEK